jgi:predicted dehydrogenase
MINVGIVGMGPIGTIPRDCYKKIDGVKLVAVCDIQKDPRRRRRFAASAFRVLLDPRSCSKSGEKLDGR